jgi:alpha-tubulin suppressor-like RCC1 family protein
VPNGFWNKPTVQCNNCRQKKPKINYFGNVVGFGTGANNLLGPLGDDDDNDIRTPRLLVNVLELDVIQVACACAVESSLALTEKGEVYAWGADVELSAVRIEGFRPSNKGAEAVIKQIQAGWTHFLALSSAGDIYVGGGYTHRLSNRKFQHIPSLLNNDNDEESSTGMVWPVHYLAGMTKKATSISSGKEFCAALLEDKTIVTWGVGTSGGMARPVPLLEDTSDEAVNEDYLHPKPPLWDCMPGEKQKVLSMACGYYHLLVVTEGHVVYSSGANGCGQLGHGNCIDREILTKIDALVGQDIATVAAGKDFSFFVDQMGRKISACGNGNAGQLGLPVNNPIPFTYREALPRRVPLVYEHDLFVEEDQPIIRQISCGSDHVLVVTKRGSVYSWGKAQSGQCGHGICEEVVARPKKLNSNLIDKFLFASAGDDLSLAVAMVDEESLSLAKHCAKFVCEHNQEKIGEVAAFLEKIGCNT